MNVVLLFILRKSIIAEKFVRSYIEINVTDATLTPNPDYNWTGGPGRSSGITTFSW